MIATVQLSFITNIQFDVDGHFGQNNTVTNETYYNREIPLYAHAFVRFVSIQQELSQKYNKVYVTCTHNSSRPNQLYHH